MTDMIDVIDVQLPEPLDDEVEREAGWFEPMPVEDEPVLFAGLCNVCAHPTYRQGYNFICTEGCKCLMLGCVQRQEDRA